jgi:hypothetical protein
VWVRVRHLGLLAKEHQLTTKFLHSPKLRCLQRRRRLPLKRRCRPHHRRRRQLQSWRRPPSCPKCRYFQRHLIPRRPCLQRLQGPQNRFRPSRRMESRDSLDLLRRHRRPLRRSDRHPIHPRLPRCRRRQRLPSQRSRPSHWTQLARKRLRSRPHWGCLQRVHRRHSVAKKIRKCRRRTRIHCSPEKSWGCRQEPCPVRRSRWESPLPHPPIRQLLRRLRN